MQIKEPPALDLDQTYPCPICSQGTLVPITLTEAWGCDRCQQILQRDQPPNTLIKLSTPYARQRRWIWNGHQWHRHPKDRQAPRFDKRTLLLSAIFVLGVTVFLLSQWPQTMPLTLIMLALVVMFWLVLQR